MIKIKFVFHLEFICNKPSGHSFINTIRKIFKNKSYYINFTTDWILKENKLILRLKRLLLMENGTFLNHKSAVMIHVREPDALDIMWARY